jgi:hypothetical protein
MKEGSMMIRGNLITSRLIATTITILLAGVAGVAAQESGTQVATPNEASLTPKSVAPSELQIQPFSAIKYSRRVKVLPDGKVQFLRHEFYPALWARDSDGRVRIQSIEFYGDCDRPMEAVPPECGSWTELVLDPVTHSMIGWPSGSAGVHAAVLVALTTDQVNNLLDVQASGLPIPSASEVDGIISTTTKNLGEKQIDGVHATGVRTTTIYSPGQNSGKAPLTLIHEVWTSPELSTVVRVIDGDPRGELTISGLKKISLQPASSLFQRPDDYSSRKIEPQFTDHYIQLFTSFFTLEPQNSGAN